MPKNTKKEKIKKEIIKDEKSLVDIAKMFDVSQPYVSQVKIEVEREIYLENLKFMWDLMNHKMKFTEKPTDFDKSKIKEVSQLI